MTSGSEPESAAPFGTLNFAELIATAWKLWRANLASLTTLFAVVFAVSIGLNIIAGEVAGGTTASKSLAVGVGVIFPLVVQVALASSGVAIASLLIAQSIESNEGTVRGALRAARSLTKEITAAALLAALVSLVAVVGLALLPYYILTIFYGPPLIAQVIALEGMPLQHATRRSRELVRGHAMRVFGYLLCIAVGILLLSALIGGLLGAAIDPLIEAVKIAVLAVFTIGVRALTAGFTAVVLTVVYFDLLARGTPPDKKARKS